MVKRCPICHLYTKIDGALKEPFEECRRCGIVEPYESED